MTWHAMGPATPDEIEATKRFASAQERQWKHAAWRSSLPWVIRIFISKWAHK